MTQKYSREKAYTTYFNISKAIFPQEMMSNEGVKSEGAIVKGWRKDLGYWINLENGFTEDLVDSKCTFLGDGVRNAKYHSAFFFPSHFILIMICPFSLLWIKELNFDVVAARKIQDHLK